jgi:TP901 family phage tail tape measure protein
MGSNTYEIKVGVKTSGEDDVKKLGQNLEAMGKITAFKKLGEQIAVTNQKMIEAQSEADRLADEMTAAEKPSRTLALQYEQAQVKVEKMAKAQRDSVSAYKTAGLALMDMGLDIKSLDQEMDGLAASSKKLKATVTESMKMDQARGLLGVRAYRDVQAEIDKLRAAYDHLKNSGQLTSKELYNAQSQLRMKTDELIESTNGWDKSLTQVNRGVVALAAAGYGLVRSFSAYNDFAQEMGKVNTMIDVSKDKFAGLTNQIVDISRRVPQSARDLAAAEYEILSSGVALENSTQVLEQSARAAVAGVTDTKTAVTAGVGVINAYGKSIGELGNVYDVMFQTVKAGRVEFPDLANNLGEILPSAISAKVAFEDISAAMAALTINGMKSPQAATAIKGAITAMAAPAPEARKKFEDLGITWQGFVPTLDAIAKKNLSLNQMRELIPDMEARNGVLILSQNMGRLNDMLGQVKDSAGSTSEAFEKMKDTPANQLALLKNELQALLVPLQGDMMEGAIIPMVKGIKAVVGGIHDADGATKSFLIVLSGGAGAFMAWKIGLAAVSFGLKGMGIDMKAAIISMRTMDIQTKGLIGSFQALGLAQKAAFVTAAAGAAYGVFEIGRLVVEVVKWRQAVAEADDAMERLKTNARSGIDRFKEFMDVKVPDNITGKSSEELKELDRQVRGAMAGYTSLLALLDAKSQETNIFGNETEMAGIARRRIEEVRKTLQGLKEDYKRVREAQGLGTKTATPKKSPDQLPGLSSEDIKKANEDRKRLSNQLEDELIKISGDGFEVRRKQAEAHYQDQLALAHGSKDLMAKAAKVRDAELAQIEKGRKEAERQAEAGRDESRLSRLNADSDFALAMLEDTYDDGQKSLEEYFTQRRTLIEDQYKAEYTMLSKLAKVEADPSRKRDLENQIHSLELNHALTMARLKREEETAKKALADKKRETADIMSDLRGRSGTDKTSQDQKELAELDKRHADELQKLRDLNAGKEQLDEAYRLQKAEKDRLMADQEKRAFELRLQNASDMAGNLSTIFSNMYELTGKKHKEFFYLQKAAAIAEATINAYLAASKALTTLPPPLSYAAAGIAMAMGLTQVAMITAQQPGYATGGPVAGYSPHDRADNIPARLTAGEFVQPVSSVRYYGSGVMEALRRKMIPREMFSHIYDNLSDMTVKAQFATGGQVRPVQEAVPVSSGGGQVVQITNIIDPRLFEQYAASSEGQKTIMNVISKNSFQVKRILSR